MEFNEFVNSFKTEDIDKFKFFLSMMPENQPKEVVTLRVFVDEWKSFIKENRSLNYYKSVCGTADYVVNQFGLQRAIGSLTYRDIEKFATFIQHKVKRGYPVHLRNCKAGFNKALKWGMIKENHFLKISPPKKQKLHPKYLTRNQFKEIKKHLKHEIEKDFVTVAFFTGMRLNEIINLKFDNIDFDSRTITVGDEDFVTKGKKQRKIPACGEVMEVLRRRHYEIGTVRTGEKISLPVNRNRNDRKDSSTPLRMTNQYVFCKGDGAKYTGDHFSKKFKAACKAAGMDNSIHFHTLRHSFASNLAQKGISLYIIKELMGHSSISVTEQYSHLNMESLREAVRLFDE